MLLKSRELTLDGSTKQPKYIVKSTPGAPPLSADVADRVGIGNLQLLLPPRGAARSPRKIPDDTIGVCDKRSISFGVW